MIRGFTVVVDPAAGTRTGLGVFIGVPLRLDTTDEQVERAVLTLTPPGSTGGHDHLVRAGAVDTGALDTPPRRLRKDAGVTHSTTRVALRAAPAR